MSNNEYIYKPTRLIVEAIEEFNENKDIKLKYSIYHLNDLELICLKCVIKQGPTVDIHFIKDDNDNDVSVKAPVLISSIPESKMNRILTASNLINGFVRYERFYVDCCGRLTCQYSLPLETPDEAVGLMCINAFLKMLDTLNNFYLLFMIAMYTEEDIETSFEIMKAALKVKRQKMESMLEEYESMPEEYDDCGYCYVDEEELSDDTVSDISADNDEMSVDNNETECINEKKKRNKRKKTEKQQCFFTRDENGEQVKNDILFTFDKDDKSIVVYTDNTVDENGNVQVFASFYNPETGFDERMPIESEDDWEAIKFIMNKLQEEFKRKKHKDEE